MKDFTFDALGTKWAISLDGEELPAGTQKEVRGYIDDFEKRFSRFLPGSEVNAFRQASPGEYQISEEFARLLAEADRLRGLTGGIYDPAVGGLLEKAGYDASYSMKPSPEAESFVLPKWTLSSEILTLSGPAVFDLGGIGKGYLIDRVADLLIRLGYKNFVVDGGGDMFATEKKNSQKDGGAWKTAIQYPGKPDLAAGVAYLKMEGLAVSSSFLRRWGKWHHLINPKLKKSIEEVIGAAAVAPSAWAADCMTSALFLSPAEGYPKAAREYKASYIVFKNDGMSIVSPNWEREVF